MEPSVVSWAVLPASGGGMPSLADISALFGAFLQPAHPEALPALFLYAGGALTVSFICSLLEATLLSVRVTELMRRSEEGDYGATLLLTYKREKVEEGIGAILTLNTVAHTIGASLAGAQAAKAFASSSLSEEAAVAGFSAMLTVAVLVATEIVPKTLGTNYASALTPYVGRGVHVLAKLLAPVLFVTGFLTRLLARGEPEGISRGELRVLVNLAQQGGAIEQGERQVMSNFLAFEQLSVSDVMTPRTVLAMLASSATVGDYLGNEGLHGHSRVPLFEGVRDNVVGYVHQRDVLLYVARGGDPDGPVSKFSRPIVSMSEDTTVGAALRTFLGSGEHIAMTQDAFGGTAGLVTLEDVVETMLGAEIVDEADAVPDLRVLAMELRDKRLARQAQGGSLPELS